EATKAFTGALATFSSREHEVAPDAALRIALESGLSAYDAEYVALARELGCTLLTNDGRIVREAPDVARQLVGPSSTAST
ncbi:MAG: type II toxin-antitoxin system VapC family toxin, partial [Spirochaetota bacterium]